MNKTISLAAITMVAVVMGMSTFAPAAMGAPNASAQADIRLCHYDSTYTQLWEVIFVHSQGSLKCHVDRHTDGQDYDIVLASNGSEDQSVCLDRNV